MSAAEEVKFSLKVMIDKNKDKVLFAEVDSDFADVLLSFLTLPLGTIVKILQKHYGVQAPAVGSLNTLYYSLADLDNVHFWTDGSKQMLLNPRSSSEAECRKLKLNVDDTPPTRYFVCGDRNCKSGRHPNISMYHDTRECDCGRLLNKPMGMRVPETHDDGGGGGDCGGVFIQKGTSFLITDDLQMTPNVQGSIIRILTNLGIIDMDGAELRTVTIGFNEIMELLKGILHSRTPLTYLILHKKQETSCATESLLHIMGKESAASSKKMIVNAVVQKSTHKLLVAQAKEDFVDFLFSLLVIPLGGVKCLLGSETSLKTIDNLYQSIADIDDQYLRTPDTKNRLIKPKLPPMYLSKNQIFPLNEQTTPHVYRSESITHENRTVEKGFWMCFKDPKGEGSYVRRPGMFMVTDDLTVTASGMTSWLSFLNGQKIPLSDVKELELQIGLEEALSILKASIMSTSALTEGLISPILSSEFDSCLATLC